MNQSKNNSWKVRFEVTFYGNDPKKGNFREIKEDSIIINDSFDIKIDGLLSRKTFIKDALITFPKTTENDIAKEVW